MSFGTFVVDESASVSSTCKAILGFRSVLTAATASGSGITGQDSDYPIGLALDASYSSEYSPDLTSNPTSCQIIFTPGAVVKTNYFTIVSKNATSSGLSVQIEVKRASTGIYETVSGFGSMTDGKPVMVYFGEGETGNYINVTAIRITLNYTSKPYIMSMMCGEAVVMPRTFSLGFQPAHSAYLDDVRQFMADEGLNLVSSRRLTRGKQLEGKINYVRMDVVQAFWDEFANHVLNSYPVCMMWNSDRPSEVIYGAQNPDRLTKPKYKNNMFTELDFDIVGWA